MEMDTKPDEQAILARCRKLDTADVTFAAWLKTYISRDRGFLGNGKNHEYWAVPQEWVCQGVHNVLSDGRRCAYLAACPSGNEESVLAVERVKAPPHPLAVRARAFGLLMIFIGMRLLDPIFKWGKKTCPQCFSRQLFKFSVGSTSPSYYCNGCNTIWPPRS
jgi:hypothetical protein